MSISLNRVILFVQDVAGLKKFYQHHFHFEPVEEIANEWAVLKAGNCEIALHKTGAGYEADDQPTGENSNVKLVFETTADLHQLRAQLVQDGVAMKEIKSFSGIDYLFCDGADIEGNVFQLMQRVG